MAATKHKDIEIYNMHRARPSKSYEEALLEAVTGSIVNGRRETITIYAYSTAAARWWEHRFGGDAMGNYEKDPDKPIEKISISARLDEGNRRLKPLR